MYGWIAIFLTIRCGGEPQFLIQTVVEKQSWKLFRDHAEKTCKPPLGLDFLPPVNYEKTLKGEFRKIIDSIHADDVRHANDLKQVWDNSVVAELQSLIAAISLQEAKIPSAPLSGEIITSDGKEEKAFPVKAKTFAEGVGKKVWEDMERKFSDARAGLGALRNSINQLITDTTKLFKQNVELTKPGQTEGRVKESLSTQKDFESPLAENLASFIARNEVEEFKTFIAQPGEPMEELNRLMTSLSYLSLRQQGIRDAREYLKTFVGNLVEHMKYRRDKVYKKFSKMYSDLLDLVSLSDTVYRESSKWPGVRILKDFSDFPLDRLLNNLNEFMGEDSHKQLVPLLNIAVNSVWHLHAHVWGLFNAYTYQPSEVRTQSQDTIKVEPGNAKARSKVFTDIIPAIIELGHKALTNKDDAAKLSATLNGESTHIRTAVDCVLYGRVDALFVAQQERSGKDFCEEFHKAAGTTLNNADITQNLVFFKNAEEQLVGKYQTELIPFIVRLGLGNGDAGRLMKKRIDTFKRMSLKTNKVRTDSIRKEGKTIQQTPIQKFESDLLMVLKKLERG